MFITRALLRLERTMNLLEGGEGRVGERGWGGDVGERGGWGSNPMIPQYLNNNLT